MASAQTIEERCIETIRFLAVDGVQKAKSGHPGMPMGAASVAHTLFTRHLRFDPADPKWPDRDRFVLSAGHASMLLYSLLHLTGYDLSLDDLKAFRQWQSKTPGHPEYGHTAGVETTTGWTLEAGGTVIFSAPPATGVHVRAGYLFDVPVRFEQDRLEISGAAFAAGDAPNVPVIEIREAA